MVGVRGGQLEILSKQELKDIHYTTLDVLEHTGVKIQEASALKILDEAGAIVDGRQQRVFFPPCLVEEMIKKAPSHYIWYARDRSREHNIRMENGWVHYSPGGVYLFIHDLYTGRRRHSVLKDVEEIMRVCDSLENVHESFGMVHPYDVPDGAAHAWMYYGTLRNFSKCTRSRSRGADIASDYLRMAAIVAGGEEELRKRPIVSCVVNPVSPLQYSKELTEGLLIHARNRIPIMFSPEIASGATGPITLAGVLTQQNAEVLAGITLAEVVSPGTPVAYGTVSTIMDMKSGVIAMGAVEMGMIGVASAQLARFYGLPCRGSGGATDSKIVDAQAGYESTLTLLLATLAGVNFVQYGGGNLESTKTASYEQLIVGNEILGMVSRMVRGIRVDDETLSRHIIDRVGPGGEYLSQRHTLKHLRDEHYIPTISNRVFYEAWKKEGAKDIREVANARAKKILKEHQPEPLDRDIDRELLRVVKEIDKRESRL